MSISFSRPASRDARARGAGVTAVLGATNTGKTHLAIERMLAHSSGLIGLPLRLLAREVYNKAVERVGADAVALITGEEKIKPPNPRFWVATVEAMPRDLDVAFLAVDEIQLAADFERGHVFTDRMLNSRGREETLVLGAATMRPMVEKLLPGASVVGRPRLSVLSFAGEKKITRLPRRSAVVAFSADEVYAIAELIRRQRGGAAVVLGALSPRTRNAQVALYQAGDVDYIVATDAIGMGLNLDVDHVAFASDRKFDGYQYRRLNPVEFAQIAGRAGRAMRDGTFGTTGRCPPFEDDLVRSLESHSFEPLKVLQWRSTDLDFSSLGALQATLAATPNEEGLTRAPVAEDILVLEHAARDDDVRAMATSRSAVERLWDVCQVPDYRKIAPATHAELAVTLFGFLMREGRIPIDWFAHQVAQADHADGDIDTLSNRIAHIRTWTFAANRPDWLEDPEHWQDVTRGVEDKLSDALHERLTERFVDRRTSVLMRRLRENEMLEPEINKSGEVVVEGHVIGRLDGFMFAAERSADASQARTLHAAAHKALAGEIDARAARLAQAPADQFVLASDGTIRWVGAAVGKLVAGEEPLRPRVRLIADEHLSGAPRDLVQQRLDLWLRTHIEKLLAPLFVLIAAEDVTGIARGVAYQVVEALGVLDRQRVAEEVKGLDQPARATLRKYGVRFGTYHVYMPALLKPAPRALAAQLFALKHPGADAGGLDQLQHLAASGRTSFPADKTIDRSLYRTIGYRLCGERAVRVDILERLADLIRPALAWREGAPGSKPAGALDGRGFTVSGSMTSLTGASGEDFAAILRSLGYRMERRPKPVEPEAATPPEAIAVAETQETLPDIAPPPAGELVDAEASTENDNAIAVVPQTEREVAAPPPPVDALEAAATAPDVPTAEIADEEPTIAAEQPDALQAQPEAAESVALNGEATADQSAAAAAPAAEQDFIEVWRPGGPRRTREGEQRGSRRRSRRTVPEQAAQLVAAPADVAPAAGAEAQAPAGDGATAPAEQRHQRPRRDRAGRSDRPERRERDGRPNRGERPERGERPRPAFGKGRRGDRKDDRRDDRGEGRNEGRTWRDPKDRRSGPDPNSPFAKLAALKEQLEADAKERT
jgi:ATP-dependent RNA helicase SUPV3L1/SUV3